MEVLQETPSKNEFKLMPFRKFLLQKQLKLKEAIFAEDIVESVSLHIPYGLDISDQRLAAAQDNRFGKCDRNIYATGQLKWIPAANPAILFVSVLPDRTISW